ncbi:putative aldolase class 2 protein PA3430 [Lineus longissimus]|uniref:putative aldolase class 2 protein PA3430 n=1 Tax=Lineus longissimus TaxID=88925 RepID=UPI002B4C9825
MLTCPSKYFWWSLQGVQENITKRVEMFRRAAQSLGKTVFLTSQTSLRAQPLISSIGTCRGRRTLVTKASATEDAAAVNRKARLELAVAYRVLDRYGMNEGVCNHLTLITKATNGEGQVMLLIPHGRHWSQVTASSLIGLNSQNEIVEGDGHNELAASTIHRGIHNIRPDASANCVMHLHSPYVTALSCLEDPRFLMIHQHMMRFYKGVGYDDNYCGYPEAVAEGERLGACMREDDVLIMGNHGLVTIGGTVAEAFDKAYYVERAAMIQLIAMSSGKPLKHIPKEVCEKTYLDSRKKLEFYANQHFNGMMKVILKETPDVAD